MNVSIAGDTTGWRRACAGTAFVGLQTERAKLVRILMAAYLVCYLGLAVLCGFQRGLMGVKVLGPLNLGYTLILGNYVLAWVLALIYLNRSGTRFDSMAVTAIQESAVALPVTSR